jgi:hypothetical protein
MKLGIATCLNLPEPDHDEALLLRALRGRGHEVSMIPWDSPTADPAEFDAVVVRSTWNYPDQPQEFMAWIAQSALKTKLLNPAEVMLWNLHKGYLQQLESEGVRIVPTIWFKASELETLNQVTGKTVIKPAVGAGSMDTRIVTPETVKRAQDWLKGFHPMRPMMLQPFVESVNSVGEQSIIVIGGTPSHRIHKTPRFEGQDEAVLGPFDVEPHFAELCATILSHVSEPTLYARVDLMQAASGEWLLSELELIEPSLFFKQCPAAVERFCTSLESML